MLICLNILYVEDTYQHRQILNSEFGDPSFIPTDESTYIEFNIDTKTWKVQPSFAWLYIDPPPLTDIFEVMVKYS